MALFVILLPLSMKPEDFIKRVRRFAKTLDGLESHKLVFQTLDAKQNIFEASAVGKVHQQLWAGKDAKDGRIKTDRGNPYTNYTTQQKKKTNKPYDRVTLKETGWFWFSMRIKLAKTAMEMKHGGRKKGIYDNFKDYATTEQNFFELVLGLSQGSAIDLFTQPQAGFNFKGELKKVVVKELGGY